MQPSGPFRLAENAVAENYRLLFYDEVGSTNDEALRLARAGHEGRSWLIAKTQKQGRGRHGRHWVSPPGNLHATLLLIDEVPLPLAPQLGFVAGVALARALRHFVGDDQRLRLKWPNDMLFDGAKLAGILLEGVGLGDGRFAAIMGIGVNCAASPPGLPYRATSLTAAGASQATAQTVFLRLSDEIVRALEIFGSGDGFAAIRAEWLTWAAGLGEAIRVDLPGGPVSGIFRSIDATGRLILDGDASIRTIDAGDVWLADARNGTCP